MLTLYFLDAEFVPRSLLLYFGLTNNAVIRQLKRTSYFDLFVSCCLVFFYFGGLASSVTKILLTFKKVMYRADLVTISVLW